MASTGVNVLRWGALVTGLFYGFTHQQAIFSSDRAAAQKQEFERKQKLISEAKAKWAEKNTPRQLVLGGDNTITNPDDPKFDFEAYLKKVEKESA